MSPITSRTRRSFAYSFLAFIIFCSFGSIHLRADEKKPETSLYFEMKPNANNNGYIFIVDDAKTRHQFEVATSGNSFRMPPSGTLPACVKMTNISGSPYSPNVEFEFKSKKHNCYFECKASGEVTCYGLLGRDKSDIIVPTIHIEEGKLFLIGRANIIVSRAFKNDGTVVSSNEFKVSSNNSDSSFILSNNARIDCKNLDIDFPQGTVELTSGSIVAKNDISIAANALSLLRLPVEKDDPPFGRLIPHIVLSLSGSGSSWRQLTVETSNPALIMSQTNNVKIAAHTITNDKGIVYAQKNMHLSFKTLTNRAGRPEQRRYTGRGWNILHNRFYDMSFDTLDIDKPSGKPEVCYATALLWAGNMLEMLIDGTKYQIHGACYRGDDSRVVNTGLIGSDGLFAFEGGDNRVSFTNGQTQPLAWGSSAFGDALFYKTFGRTLQFDSLFMRKKFISIKETTQYKPLDSPLYVNRGESKAHEELKLSDVNKFFMDPTMEAESACVSIAERTGHMLLSDEQSCPAQLDGLKQEGILFGEVNGELIPKDGFPAATSEESHSRELWNNLTQQDKKIFEDTAQQHRIDATRTGFNLFHNKRLHLTGNYGIVLSNFDDNHRPNKSFFYYQYPDKYRDREFYSDKGPAALIPAVYIAVQDYINFHPEAMLKAKEARFHGTHLNIINTGSIVTAKKLEIKAESFINTKLVNKTTKEVPEGFSGTRKYTVRIPQEGTGVVLGLDIDIVTDKDAINQGGTIKATHNIKLVSKHGNVENTYLLSEEVVQWDPGLWGKVLGKDSSAKAATFVGGTIEGGGDVSLLAEAGRVINLASTVDAGENAVLDGFLGVVTENCAHVHKVEDSVKWGGLLSIKSVMREAANIGMARIIARHGDVTLQSKNGKVRDRGTSIDAEGNIFFKGEKGNDSEAFAVKTHWRTSTFGVDSDGILHEEKTGTDDNKKSSRYKAGKSIRFITSEDNNIEIEDIIAGEKVEFKAGGANNIKGVTRCYETDTKGWSLRTAAFGLTALKALFFNEDLALALEKLAENDPFIRSFIATISADKPSKMAYRGAFSAAEFVRLLDHINSNGKHAGTINGLIAKRLGLSQDGQGFSPTINFHLGRHEEHEVACITTTPTIHAQNVEMNSGKSSSYAGLKFDGLKEITITTGEDLIFIPGDVRTYKSESVDVGASVSYAPGFGITGAGVDAGYSKNDAKQRSFITVPAQTTAINVGKKMEVFNYVLGGPDTTVTIDVKGDCIIGTTPDEDYMKRYQAALFFNSDTKPGSFGFAHATEKTIQAIGQGGFAAGTKIKLKVGGKLILKGALLDGIGEIEANDLEVYDIELMRKNTETTVGFTYSKTDTWPLQGGASYERKNIDRAILHSVIGENIKLTVKNGIPEGLQRDASKAREELNPEWNFVGIPVIIPNLERLNELSKEWRSARQRLKTFFDKTQKPTIKEFDKHEELLRKAQATRDAQSKSREHDEKEETNRDAPGSEQSSSQAEPKKETLKDECRSEANPQDDYFEVCDDNTDQTEYQEAETFEKLRQVKREQSQASVDLLEKFNSHEYIHTTKNGKPIIISVIENKEASSEPVDMFELAEQALNQHNNKNTILLKNSRFFIKISGDDTAFDYAIYDRQEFARDFITNKKLADIAEISHDKGSRLLTAASIILDFIPIVGNVKVGIEAIRGRDLVTGEQLAWWQRAINVAGVALPLVSRFAKATREIKIAEEIIREVGKTEKVFAECEKVERTLLNILTPNGVKITGFTKHGLDRAIGDGAKRLGVGPAGILDALKNPLKIGEVVIKDGKKGQSFTGKMARVIVNPDTGKIISINPISSAKSARLLKDLGV